MPKLISLTISGELLTALISRIKPIPGDATILKIVPSQDMTYSFDVILETEEGHEVAEGGCIPRMQNDYQAIKEGPVKKGGHNLKPSSPRPSRPSGLL